MERKEGSIVLDVRVPKGATARIQGKKYKKDVKGLVIQNDQAET